jgi:hypothetical protein
MPITPELGRLGLEGPHIQASLDKISEFETILTT